MGALGEVERQDDQAADDQRNDGSGGGIREPFDDGRGDMVTRDALGQVVNGVGEGVGAELGEPVDEDWDT